MKTITIVLEDLRESTLTEDHNAFRVKKATNTIEYPVGTFVTKEQARKLCNKAGYTINIIAKS